MSLDRILRILEGFGVSKADAEVYIYLSKNPPATSAGLAVAFGKTRQQIYQAIRRLKIKGVVTHGKSRQMLFSALSFEELLERYVKFNMEQARIIEETKEQLLTNREDGTKQHGVE